MSDQQLYIGLMSGTSADGIDLALVDFARQPAKLIEKHYQAYDQSTHQDITALYQSGSNEIDRAFSLDIVLAQQFVQAIKQLLKKADKQSHEIIAIGNHGQTIRHRPTINAPFTLQIGCSQTLATLTNIRVIGQFRRKDMALGGQGAPLVPAFHRALFASEVNDVFIVNIGGIANITYLPCDPAKQILGFDTGPGNALIDDWYQKHHDGRYDDEGKWAKSGTVNQVLLRELMLDDYFQLSGPKSTGREHFHLAWLMPIIARFSLKPEDIQATLTALTALSISEAIAKISTKSNVYICGGGALNIELYSQLNQQLNDHSLAKTDDIGANSDSLEAFAFAWFAYAFDKKILGNISAVTGACKEVVLGSEFNP